MIPNKIDSPELEETIVAPQPTDYSLGAATAPRVEFISGSGPKLETETQALLRVRLRAAAIVLLAAVGTFFVRGFFVQDAPARWVQAAVAVCMAGVVGLLSTKSMPSLPRLRQLEFATFGLIGVYLGIYEYELVLVKANAGNPIFELAAIKSCVLYFFAVILLYGTFIPNTWQRAARIIIPMTLAPFIVSGLLRFSSSAVASIAGQVADFEQTSDNVIMMVLGAVAALYGTHIINTLRVEAFKARQMGQYHLKERLGAGGMGEVFLAEHCLLKRPCAIKFIRPDSQTDPSALSRFEREVRTTAKLSHWNTVSIYDYGRTDDGTFYYVMEYLPGLSLADLVKRHGPLPPARAIHLLRQTCRALHEAHAKGLVHRDIKPANIFAARLGGVYDVAKLLDFGLVQTTSDHENAQPAEARTISGSPFYMSPEQATAAIEPDARSDIYSLGTTAYYLLTGKPPFEGANIVQVMLAHSRNAVVPPSQIQSAIPADLDSVVLRCLAKRPADRFQNVLSLEESLAGCGDADRWTNAEAEEWWRGEGERTVRDKGSQATATTA